MFRSIPVILALLAEVGVTGPRAKTYAPVLQEVGKKHNVDPATIISIVKGESGWRAGIVNSLGCVGLGQICLGNYSVCQNGQRNSAACQAKKKQLQNGVYNLRVMGQAITANRKMCNKRTNKRTKKSRSQWRHWLPSYGGYNKPKQGIWCGQKRVKTKRGMRWRNVPIPKRIVQYMKRRKRIIRAVNRKMRRRKK
jgi:hypothetical protein